MTFLVCGTEVCGDLRLSRVTREQPIDKEKASMTAPPASQPRHAARALAGSADGRGFRRDIEGLRAVAVGLVLAYHAGLPLISGGFVGVDVFFVISGFLITSLLLREIETTGRVHMASFWARRVRRLLPAATVVLLATVAATWAVGPVTQRTLFAGDIIASATSVVNWRLADRSVDYLAEDVGVSPVQHFWSLAVEEQFYVVWPLLIAVVAAVALKRGRGLRSTSLYALAAILIPSFGWSLLYTSSEPLKAYFVTTTRLWELAVGAIIAVASVHLTRVGQRTRAVLAWVGLILIAIAAFGLEATDPFPGWRAAVPVVGAALVIAAAIGGGSGLAQRVLSWGPLVWIGGLSYSLYLWHWPMLVVLQDWMGFEGRRWGVVIVLASILPAWLSRRFVEDPVRFSRTLRGNASGSLSVGLNLVLASVVAALMVVINPLLGATTSTSPSGPPEDVIGARALGDDPESSVEATPRASYGSVEPNPLVAHEDIPECWSATTASDELNPCAIGDPDGDVAVVVLGDSKIQQYADAFDGVFAELGWSGTVMTKSSCAFSDARSAADGGTRPYTGCEVFNGRVLEWLDENPQDLAITSQRLSLGYLGDDFRERTEEDMVAGLAARWTALQDRGTEIIVVLDNPAPPKDLIMLECTAANPDAMDTCSFDRADAIAWSAAPTQLKAAALVPDVQVVDFHDYICPGESCTPVIGGALVYRQGSHITSTYAQSMHDVLVERLSGAYRVARES
ncbi:acyltransferase family protein [Demequina muriae]|uniref:Acyltransferase family protein n=1 Tax=Demequina muriae TaxID=3051664 RepID=A0ABT8GG80_9MICO|nr:acyltransferase family protein [Demequina sp. EGI L300058]MDN4480437.1 acyltransferase family protein [Demequina sp. EGI L300058]